MTRFLMGFLIRLLDVTTEPRLHAPPADLLLSEEEAVRLDERARLSEALFAESDRFTKGAFAQGIRHAATRLRDPSFHPNRTELHQPDDQSDDESDDRSQRPAGDLATGRGPRGIGRL